MNRSLAIGCAASVLLVSTVSLAAGGSPDTARCADYAKLVTDHQSLKDGGKTIDENSEPSDVFDVLQSCPSQAKLYKAFEVVGDFIDLQGGEDGPKGTDLSDPNATDAEKKQAQEDLKAEFAKTINGYEQQVKTGKVDAGALKTVMRYMIWQKTKYNSDEEATLELLARMYPADYPSVRELVKQRDGNDDVWKQVGDRWLPKSPPAKH